MKKLLCVFIMMMAPVLLCAQGKALPDVAKSVRKAISATKGSAKKNPAKGKMPITNPRVTPKPKQMANPGGKTQPANIPQERVRQSDIAKIGQIPHYESRVPTKVERWDRISAEADKILALTQKDKEMLFHAGIGKSVLFAPLLSSQEIGYSVTVFKTNYQGKEEIFGILPSHALPNDFSHRFDSVAKDFQVKVKGSDGTTRAVNAQVVQISPQSMLDISLVKFDTQDEFLLAPLRLAQESAQLNETLFSYGYAAGKETYIERTVNALSFLSVRTNQAIEGAREGFCGSPLLDINGNIKAIHTGTVEKKDEDVSFGTNVEFIKLLVEAYHNQGHAQYDLVLLGNALARLNIDEYISAFYLYDANGKKILQQNFDGKFSQSVLLGALKDRSDATYLQLTSRKAQFEDEAGLAILKENRKGSDKTKRQHWYDLKNKKILDSRPEGIKM